MIITGQTHPSTQQYELFARIHKMGEGTYKTAAIHEVLKRRFGLESRQECWGGFLQLLAFLWLRQIRPLKYTFPAPPNIEALWQEFMLFSKEYSHFCKSTVGDYIHHSPETSNISITAGEPVWLPEVAEIKHFIGPSLTFIDKWWGDEIFLEYAPHLGLRTTNLIVV